MRDNNTQNIILTNRSSVEILENMKNNVLDGLELLELALGNNVEI